LYAECAHGPSTDPGLFNMPGPLVRHVCHEKFSPDFAGRQSRTGDAFISPLVASRLRSEIGGIAMRTLGGIFVGLLIWAFLFLLLPQEFLGGAVGRPFDMDDGQLIIRYPWGMVLMVVGFFAIPFFVAKAFRDSGDRR